MPGYFVLSIWNIMSMFFKTVSNFVSHRKWYVFRKVDSWMSPHSWTMCIWQNVGHLHIHWYGSQSLWYRPTYKYEGTKRRAISSMLFWLPLFRYRFAHYTPSILHIWQRAPPSLWSHLNPWKLFINSKCIQNKAHHAIYLCFL